LSEKVLGKEHPDTLTSMNNLAFLLQSQGKYDEAEPISRQILALMEKVLGKEHPDTGRSEGSSQSFRTTSSTLQSIASSVGRYGSVLIIAKPSSTSICSPGGISTFVLGVE
jgi:hypothetical protein